MLTSIKFSELLFLLFIFYVIIKNLMTNTLETSAISYLLFFVILYYSLKTFFSVNNLSSYSKLLFCTTAILVAYLAYAIYNCYFEQESLTNLYIPNKSIFSILLASQVVFIFPIWDFYKKSKKPLRFASWLFIGLLVASLLILSLTQGRAGWLGLIVSIFYIAYQSLSGPWIKRIAIYLSLPLFCMLTAAMFFYKSDSSNGRLLIFKISAGMLKDNWLFGIGQGQFKVYYNDYQAEYFSSHNLDSKEALLADNTFYAFNDFFQALIENGLIAFLILAAIMFLLIHQKNKTEITSGNKHLFTAAVASLICILTGSLFSYPLQIFPIAIQATLCLAIINSYPSSLKNVVTLSKKGIRLARVVFVLLSAFLFFHISYYFYYKQKGLQAFELNKSGFRQEAIKTYKELSSSYIKDGNMLYLYAQELYYSNQLIKSQRTLNKAKSYFCSNDVYKLSASIEKELKNFEQAEKDYKTAIYMVPNRMISRKNLLDFYLERKDTVNAIYWAQSIINMPVKIPSQITKAVQKNTYQILQKIN